MAARPGWRYDAGMSKISVSYMSCRNGDTPMTEEVGAVLEALAYAETLPASAKVVVTIDGTRYELPELRTYVKGVGVR